MARTPTSEDDVRVADSSSSILQRQRQAYDKGPKELGEARTSVAQFLTHGEPRKLVRLASSGHPLSDPQGPQPQMPVALELDSYPQTSPLPLDKSDVTISKSDQEEVGFRRRSGV